MATYEVRYTDGSTEVLEADNVGEAKRRAKRLLPDAEVEHVTFLDDLNEEGDEDALEPEADEDGDDDEDDEEDDEDDEED
jgi:hypothetical protein